MKRILFIWIISSTVPAWSQSNETLLNWHSLAEAQSLQKEKPRKGILIYFYTNWATICKMMENKTFSDPALIQYLKQHFYMVKFNAEGDEIITFNKNTYSNPLYKSSKSNSRNHIHEFTKFNDIEGYPSLVYYNNLSELKNQFVGYKTPQLLLELLKNEIKSP